MLACDAPFLRRGRSPGAAPPPPRGRPSPPAAAPPLAAPPPPPPTPPPPHSADPVTDNYSGIKISDSYRWLENAKSPETRAFIDAENAYTARYLKEDHIHSQAVDDLGALEQVSAWTEPIARGDDLFFMKR